MHSFVSVCVFWLESWAGLRWAAADILVCFNPLANKTAGNHQKNPPAGQGGEHWVGEKRRGEDVWTQVWIKKELKQGMKERREKREGLDWAHRCREELVVCVCVCVSQHGGSGSGSCCFCGVRPATPDNLHLSLPY